MMSIFPRRRDDPDGFETSRVVQSSNGSVMRMRREMEVIRPGFVEILVPPEKERRVQSHSASPQHSSLDRTACLSLLILFTSDNFLAEQGAAAFLHTLNITCIRRRHSMFAN